MAPQEVAVSLARSDHSVRRLNSQRALSTYVLTSLWLLDGRNGEKTEVGESILVALSQALFIQANVGQSSESWKSDETELCSGLVCDSWAWLYLCEGRRPLGAVDG